MEKIADLSKKVLVARIFHEGKTKYLTGAFWSDDLSFEAINHNFDPLFQIGVKGNKSVKEEDFIVKSSSLEEMSKFLEKCKEIPDVEIEIVEVNITMNEKIINVSKEEDGL